jgi:hypothetical protein
MQRQRGLLGRGFRALSIIGGGLVVSSIAASSPAQGTQVVASYAAASASTVPRAGGNVQVVVPPALVAPSDGLTNNLTVGKSYELVVHVWLAAGQARTNAIVTISGAQTQHCAAKQLVAGSVVTMRCQVVPTLAAATGLVVRVAVDVHAAPKIVAMFTHRVSGSASR